MNVITYICWDLSYHMSVTGPLVCNHYSSLFEHGDLVYISSHNFSRVFFFASIFSQNKIYTAIVIYDDVFQYVIDYFTHIPQDYFIYTNFPSAGEGTVKNVAQ